MNMKNALAFVLLLAGIGIFISSCNKTMSGDEPFPDERWSSVYITPSSNKLYAYHPETGKKQWEYSLSGNSNGSPVILNNKMYVATDKKKLYCFDLLKRKLVWEITMPSASIASLAADDSTIYVPGNALLRYDTSGNLIWQYNGGAPCSSSPQYVAGKIYVACGISLHCVNLSGNVVWSTAPIPSGVILSSVHVNTMNNVAYFGAGDYKIYAVNAGTGALVWNYQTAGQVNSSPMVYGGMCILGSDDNAIYCIDEIPGIGGFGQLRWKVNTGERVRSSAAIHPATNTVLIGSHDFNLYALDHVTGTLLWKYPAGSLIASSPVVSGNKVIFAAYDNYLYCVDVRFGTLLWKTNMDYQCIASPIVDNITSVDYSSQSGMSTY